jgi:hypothetical protein
MTAATPETPSSRHGGRRLLFLLIWLFIFDQFIPATLASLERHRYESPSALRFENSDLFGLGPLVTYLRENPRHSRRRAVFLGNSMMFGFSLRAEDALPAQFEQERPGTHAFNMALNGQELGTTYLMAKAIIDSVDVLFVQITGESANRVVASLIPIDKGDLQRFGLQPPDPLEQWLKEKTGRVWHLYGANERIQAAIFGTSTREYLYLHKRDILMALLRRRAAPPPSRPLVNEQPILIVPPANRLPFSNHALTSQEALVRRFAALGRSHHKRVVFLEFEYGTTSSLASFDPANVPNAEVVIIHVPATLTFDGQHLTEQGCHRVAQLLAPYDAQHASGDIGK